MQRCAQPACGGHGHFGMDGVPVARARIARPELRQTRSNTMPHEASRTAATDPSGSACAKTPTAGPDPHTNTARRPGFRTLRACSSPGTTFSQMGGNAVWSSVGSPFLGREKDSASAAARRRWTDCSWHANRARSRLPEATAASRDADVSGTTTFKTKSSGISVPW